MKRKVVKLFGVCSLAGFSFAVGYYGHDVIGKRLTFNRTGQLVTTTAVVPSKLDRFPALKSYVTSLRRIPAGFFHMGSNSVYGANPEHKVMVSEFRMGATPVSVAVWKEYCSATGMSLPKAPSWGWLDDHPIVGVSWNDICGSDGKSGFCGWASEVVGQRLTLPTEAQFEYASRGGLDGDGYPWGNTHFDRSKLWCSNKEFGDAGQTAPVNRLTNISTNWYGLSDMTGNVPQWCSDLYGPYSSRDQTDPRGPSSTQENERCFRGCSWMFYEPGVFLCAYRWSTKADTKGLIGFRLTAGPE